MTVYGMKLVGRLEFLQHLHNLSQRQLDQLADVLSGYAADLKKRAVTGKPVVDLYVEPE